MEQTRKTAPIVMTVRLGGRRMTLTWRPRKRMPGLLQALLSRSLRALAGALLGGMSATALAQVSASALPTGPQLVAGQALISQLSNQMRVSQSTDKAIINWNTFNIGSAARVDFQMPSSTSAVLNRVITNNPSSLMGTLTGNGRVWLVNPAGIMVGPGATIDVAGFIGSTLSVRNEDFLADRLNFSGSGAAVSNFGNITTPQGGNVYLIGSSVENQGLIRAPGGEVLLGAGQTVEIADTGTPGVKVAITGTEGNVLNVGQVLAEAGRVGMAGVLVRNAGSINASSVVKEGGRIFLRATKSVTTDASSVIQASGTSGGEIRLVAEETARVDGSLVARGSEGRGGFVETSGKIGFAILRAPDVGPGGEWLIDPNNISVKAAERANNPANEPATETAVVTTELLQEALNAGTNVSIVTTAEPGTESGDINVFDAIVKTAGSDATLTLNAQRNINLQQAITATSGKLNVALSHAGTAALSNSIALNGGSLTSSGQLIFSGATLDNVKLDTNGTGAMASIVTGGTTSMVGGSTWNNYGQVDFQGAGKLQLAAGTSFGNMVGGTVNLTGYADKAIASTGGSVFNSGMINKFGSDFAALDSLTNIGTVNVHSGKLSLTGSGSYGGTFNVHSNASSGASTVLAFQPGAEQTANLSGAAINLVSSEGVDNARVDFSGSAGSATFINNALSLARATMTGGALGGSGKLTVTDFGWSGGTIRGAADDAAYGFTNLALSGNTRLDGRRLVLAAGGTSNAQFANLMLTNNAQLDNLGVLSLMEGSRIGYPTVGGDDVNTQVSTFGSISDDGGAINRIGAINNAGTINSASYGANNWLGGSSGEGAVTFNNSGVVNVNAGTLKLASGVHSGTFNVNAGSGDIDTVLRFAPSAAFGAGVITLGSSAVINQNGSNNSSATIAFGSAYPNGVVNIDGDLSLQRVALDGAVLQGAGKLSASQLDVSGGTLRGTGSGPSWDFGQLNLANHLGIDNRAVNLGPGGGSTALEGAGLHLTNGSVLTSTGTHSVGSIDNAGVLRVNSGTLSATRLGNYGLLAVGSDARFSAGSELTNFEHGTVSGAGTIEVAGGEGTLQNFGRLQPGANGEIGTLTIRGGLQQGASASMEIKLSGKETGMFDRISVSGDVALGGSLFASYQNDYKPAAGDAMPFLLADGQRTGTFQTVVAGEHMQAGYSLFAGEATRLTALLPATRYFNNSVGDLDWSTAGNWTGGVLPGAADEAIINTGYAVGHTSGDDVVNRLSINSGNALNIYGGSVTVGSATIVDGLLSTSGDGSFTANGSLSGSGSLNVLGGRMTLNGASTIGLAGVSGGVLRGSGSLHVNDLLWTGGAISGSALDPAWNINNLHLSGLSTLEGRTLNLASGGNSTANGASLLMSSGARINNAGVLTLANGSFLGYPVAGAGNSEINNAGVIIGVTDAFDPRVNAIGGVQQAGVSSSQFNNLSGATVIVQDSTLELGPGSHAGALQLNATGATGAKLTFYHHGGVVDLNAGTSISESRANGGLTTVQFGNPKSSASGDAAGMTRVNTNLTLDNVILGSGILAGSAGLTATNLAWQGGTIRGNGDDPAFNVTNLSTDGSLALEGRTLNLLAGGSGTARASTTMAINGSGILNSAGNVTLGDVVNAGAVNVSGGQLGTASFTNSGRARLASGTTLAAAGGFINLEGGSLAGNGTVNTGQYYLVNSGRLAAGGRDSIGTLAVQGNLQQTATGVTEIELGSGGQFDRVSVSGNVLLDGRLAVSLLGSASPAVDDSRVFLTMGGARSGSFAVTDAPNGLQAGYSLFAGEAARLTMLPTSATSYFNNAGGDFSWSNQANWAGGVLPGASDDVWIDAGSTIRHSSGTDSIGKLRLQSATPLSVSGGSLSVGGASTIDGTLTVTSGGTYTANGAVSGSGTMQLAGGSAVLNAATSLPTLAISSGTVSGTGSLAVTRSFSQTGGAFNMPGTVTLTQQSGNLSIANMIAGDLKLIASAGAISQTAGLRATSLQTSSTAGTLLTNANNRITSFKGSNAGTGNIALLNVSSPSSLVLNGITNTAPGGNISIDNTGGVIDNAPIVTTTGRVSLIARSPLVVNAPISAGSNVTLQAMSSTGGSDNLTINSSVTSTSGSLQLSAGSALSVSSTGSLSVTNGTIGLTSISGTVTVAEPTSIFGATPSITVPPPPVTTVPVTTVTTDTTVVAATTTIVDSTNKTSTQSSTTPTSSTNSTVAPVVTSTTGGTNTNTLSLAGDQTVGGTTGTFGGASAAPAADTGGSFAGGAGTTVMASNESTSSTSSSSSSPPSSSSTSSSEPSAASSSSSQSSSSSSDSGSGSKKDEKSAKEDKSEKQEKKPQTATKSARKSLPVCS
jgi:filamentous hemagglutinin family protein